MLANYHTHTFRCRHALGEDREYIEHAIDGGLKVLGFSDHCPWIFDDGFVSGIRMLPSQLDGYFTSLTDLKKEYASDIKIYIGFESEYIPELMEAQDKLLNGYPVDYMIMGEHFLEREPYSDYTGSETYNEGFLKKYVDTVIDGLNTGKYKYLAHPDLLNYIGPDKIYERHFTRLCRYLKEHDIPIEINLLGLIGKRHYPSGKFLKIAQKTGNKAIIGCDAHQPDILSSASMHEKCYELAKKYNLIVSDFLPELDK